MGVDRGWCGEDKGVVQWSGDVLVELRSSSFDTEWTRVKFVVHLAF